MPLGDFRGVDVSRGAAQVVGSVAGAALAHLILTTSRTTGSPDFTTVPAPGLIAATFQSFACSTVLYFVFDDANSTLVSPSSRSFV